MATSGPITYLVMADQFPSVAAPRGRLTQGTGMSGPLTGVRREAGWAGGDARERPVCPARSADFPRAVLGHRRRSGPATSGALCPWCCRADGSPLPLTGPARGVALYPVA